MLVSIKSNGITNDPKFFLKFHDINDDPEILYSNSTNNLATRIQIQCINISLFVFYIYLPFNHGMFWTINYFRPASHRIWWCILNFTSLMVSLCATPQRLSQLVDQVQLSGKYSTTLLTKPLFVAYTSALTPALYAHSYIV